MLDIEERVKEAYQGDSVPKEVYIRLYNRTTSLYPSDTLYPSNDVYPDMHLHFAHEFRNTDIISETMTIVEALCGGEISYRNCVSSSLDVEITNVKEDIQGMDIQVLQVIGDATIPLFKGIIDTAKKSGAKTRRKIKAYDSLYFRYKENITEWYNSLSFPMTCYDFRIALCKAFGMPYVVQTLINDDIYVNKAEVSNITGRDLLMMIGEFNGAFVQINRNNQIKFVTLYRYNYIYPSNDRFPEGLFPGAQTNAKAFEQANTYIDCEYGDYMVQEINRLTVKENGENVGTYGTGLNSYNIEDNVLFVDMDADVMQDVLEGIYANIGGIYYIPHKTTIKGRPYVECGDVINVKIGEMQSIDTYVFKRTLKGVQSLRDTYEADGEECHSKLYEVGEWIE